MQESLLCSGAGSEVVACGLKKHPHTRKKKKRTATAIWRCRLSCVHCPRWPFGYIQQAHPTPSIMCPYKIRWAMGIVPFSRVGRTKSRTAGDTASVCFFSACRHLLFPARGHRPGHRTPKTTRDALRRVLRGLWGVHVSEDGCVSHVLCSRTGSRSCRLGNGICLGGSTRSEAQRGTLCVSVLFVCFHLSVLGAAQPARQPNDEMPVGRQDRLRPLVLTVISP